MHYDAKPCLPFTLSPASIAWVLDIIVPSKHVSPSCIVLQRKQNVEHGTKTDDRRGCPLTKKICELLVLLATSHFVLEIRFSNYFPLD